MPGVIWLPTSFMRFGYFGGNLPREMHVKTQFANLPGDEVTCFWNAKSEKAVDAEAFWIGADQAGCAPIGKKKKRQHLLEVLCLLQMEGAELQIQNQHHGIGSDRTMWCADFSALIAA